jgi:hypothetical protein
MIMNYRPMFEFASGERLGNAQVFATREEAQAAPKIGFRVWTMPTGCGEIGADDETADAVTYRQNIGSTATQVFATREEGSDVRLHAGPAAWTRPEVGTAEEA